VFHPGPLTDGFGKGACFHPPRAWKANLVWWMDHIGLLVSDLARAKNFYGACLAPRWTATRVRRTPWDS
jgi:hypothetical protein